MSPVPVDASRRWAKYLPRDFARRLAEALNHGPDAVHALRTDAVLPASAMAVRLAQQLADQGMGPFTAGLLQGRLDTLEEQPQVTPVWTGPNSPSGHDRLTLAVLADLIAEARREILLVSYATWPSSEVKDALTAATTRGVTITLLLERTQDNAQFSGHEDPFPGLAARRLHWPATARPPGASMHAKLLVVDQDVALVGSANLTGFGLERNLEAGLLIRGGPVPAQLVDHVLSTPDLVPLHETRG